MSLTMFAKISAVYLGLMVSAATGSTLWDQGQKLSANGSILNPFQTESTGSSG